MDGATALACAVEQASASEEQAEIVRLLLQLRGPVEEVTSELRHLADSQGMIKVHALWAHDEQRKLMTLSAEGLEGCRQVLLEYSARELRLMPRNVKIRSDDEAFRAKDPRGRPLMPPEGEEVPEEERAKQVLMKGFHPVTGELAPTT
ncbi:uncharacterized protein LTR77_011113 [Saxophila tyrrhenica]|uniref:Uncharacterized protein n=1 Tax=Saxophila tyrrhenica TaxID=1690608 RepID=A0AAV9NW03_9PEZI|nr:hypothetical protein LTR77_011113 [Saxophila tyrrhenica]